MKTIERITEQITEEITKLTAKKLWLEKNAPDAENLHSINESANLFAVCFDYNRDKVLTEMADLFGADGWTAKVKLDRINWEKEIDGMLITIHDAKRMPKESTSYPVQSSDFPLQIASSNE